MTDQCKRRSVEPKLAATHPASASLQVEVDRLLEQRPDDLGQVGPWLFGSNLVRLGQAIDAVLYEKVDLEHGVPMTVLHAISLEIVIQAQLATVSDLARALGYSGGATTRLADALEGRGLVTRERSHSDRRIIFLNPTEFGHSVFRSWLSAKDRVLRGAMLPLRSSDVD